MRNSTQSITRFFAALGLTVFLASSIIVASAETNAVTTATPQPAATSTPPASDRICACPEQLKECIPAQSICEVPKGELDRKIKVYAACDDNPCRGSEASAQWLSFGELMGPGQTGVCGKPDANGQCVGQGNRKSTVQYGAGCRKSGKNGCALFFAAKSEQCKPNFFGGQDGVSIGRDDCGDQCDLSQCSVAACEVTRLDSKKDCRPVPTRTRQCSWVKATPPPSGGGTTPPAARPTTAPSPGPGK
jgi:hypothetical protein